MAMDWLKLEIYIPESHFLALQRALQSVDAGHIGNYDSCLSYSRVKGAWRPLRGAMPYNGTEGVVSEAEELKVEVNVSSDKLTSTLRAIRTVHPYEEPVINVIPLCAPGEEALMEETKEIQEQRRLLGAKYRRAIPQSGEVWDHFKGNEYKIVACPVMHTESQEFYCVYQALYGSYGIYCRPLDMFMSEVDHEKYPQAGQKYRFEKK